MTNQEIAKNFSEIAKILTLHGENTFKANAYETTAEIVRHSILSPQQIVVKAKLGQIKGIGKQLAADLEEFLNSEQISHIEEIKKNYPSTLFELFEISGIGPKKIKYLFENLNVRGLEDLEKLCLENKLSAVKGFGEKSQDKIHDAINFLKMNSGKSLFKRAFIFAEELKNKILQENISSRVEISGQVRKLDYIVDEIIYVILVTDKNLLQQLKSIKYLHNLREEDNIIYAEHLLTKLKIKFLKTNADNFNFLLLKTSAHTQHQKELNIDELSSLVIESEEKFYHQKKLAFIPPECREGIGEIDEAKDLFLQGKKHFELVTHEDLKGIIHAHSTYSDGHNTLEEIALYIKEMGLEYLAISDHSQSAAYAGGLKIDKIKKQHAEIDKLNEKLKPFHIFKGIESDILADGSLDYPNDILALFDFVIISIHSNFEMSEEAMTARIIKAIENPYSTILAHPSGRLLLKRKEYKVNFQAVLESAAKNKVIVEINSNPKRLDLDWSYFQIAKKLGVYFSINPDAHSLVDISNIEFGINVARKGRLKKVDILSTLCLDDLKKYFQNAKK